jgi:hypothetical protein
MEMAKLKLEDALAEVRPGNEVRQVGLQTLNFEELSIAGPPAKELAMINYEALSRMSLESLLYYVLVGDGRVGTQTAGEQG